MSQRCYEITDFAWSVMEPLLPNKPRGLAAAGVARSLRSRR